MKTDITEDLPKRIRNKGGKLFREENGKIIKFTLECRPLEYRGFIYVSSDYRDADGSLKDLYNNFYFENGIGVLANR